MTDQRTATLQTDRSDITRTRWHESEHSALGDGEVRLRVEHFALTANNATYAHTGEVLSYWRFFPQSDEKWGCVPVWGYAEVAESRCEGLSVGDRFFGFLPFASDVTMTPARVGPHGFTDAAPHRADLPSLYNNYVNVAGDPTHAPELDAYNALLRPLFITSYLIADWLADQDFLGAEAIVISSASSKTGFGTAYALSQLPDRDSRVVVGLSSPGNLAFTTDLGLYDEVLAYADVAHLPADRPTVYVDLSGSMRVRRAVHEHCTQLRHSVAVGMTHWQEAPSQERMPDPQPEFFFAPSHAEKRSAELGRGEFFAATSRAMAGFVATVARPEDPMMTIAWHRGPDAAQAAYSDVVEGRSEPSTAIMISL